MYLQGHRNLSFAQKLRLVFSGEGLDTLFGLNIF